MLVEELWCCVDVVIRSSIGPADDHNGQTPSGRGGGVVDAVVIDRRLEKVGVVFEPVKQCVKFCTERLYIQHTILAS